MTSSTARAPAIWSRVAAVALSFGLVAAPRGALAQVSAADRAAAQALFDEGVGLMDRKEYASACPKFEESNRLDPAIGTRFDLADCYARTGKMATAWTLFLDVAAATKAAGQTDRERLARARARELEPKLAKLRILVPNAAKTPGLEVKRDGSLVSAAVWGAPLPIDEGDHAISASAPGMKPWSGSVVVRGERAMVDATVPALEPLPPDAPASAPPIATAPSHPPVSDERPSSGGRILGIAAIGFGVVGVGVGAASGLIAISKNNDAHGDVDKCPLPNSCRPAGLAELDSARTAATVSTIAFIAGGVAIAGGLVLVITARKTTPATALRIAPMAGPKVGGVSLGGEFL